MKNVPIVFIGEADRNYWSTLDTLWLLDNELEARQTDGWDIVVGPAGDNTRSMTLCHTLFNVTFEELQ